MGTCQRSSLAPNVRLLRGHGYSKGFGYYDKGEGYDANEGKGYGYSKKYGRGHEAGEGERYGHDKDCNCIYIVKAISNGNESNGRNRSLKTEQ